MDQHGPGLMDFNVVMMNEMHGNLESLIMKDTPCELEANKNVMKQYRKRIIKVQGANSILAHML
jgi:hypothetical protein